MAQRMNTYIALLRAVNVGGTGKLPMAELRALCEAAGFADVRTYIASGNVVFRARGTAQQARAALEGQLLAYAGSPIGVVVRTPEELQAVIAGNPFPEAAGNRLVVLFFDSPVPTDALDTVRHQGDEQLHLSGREIYVHYGTGMGKSRLVIPAASRATGRNLNTVRTLAAMAAAPGAA